MGNTKVYLFVIGVATMSQWLPLPLKRVRPRRMIFGPSNYLMACQKIRIYYPSIARSYYALQGLERFTNVQLP